MKYRIDEVGYQHFRNIELREGKKIKDAFLFQVAEIAGKFSILYVKDFFQENGKFYMQADVKQTFNSQIEASACIRKMGLVLQIREK